MLQTYLILRLFMEAQLLLFLGSNMSQIRHKHPLSNNNNNEKLDSHEKLYQNRKLRILPPEHTKISIMATTSVRFVRVMSNEIPKSGHAILAGQSFISHV